MVVVKLRYGRDLRRSLKKETAVEILVSDQAYGSSRIADVPKTAKR